MATNRRGDPRLKEPVHTHVDPGLSDGEFRARSSCGLRIGKLGRVDDNGRVLPDDDEARFGKAGKRLCADIDGWSQHAAVTVHSDDDEGRENLCRYTERRSVFLPADKLALILLFEAELWRRHG